MVFLNQLLLNIIFNRRNSLSEANAKKSLVVYQVDLEHRHNLFAPSIFGRRSSQASTHLEAAKILNKSKSSCDLRTNMNSKPQTIRKEPDPFKQRTEKTGLVLAAIVLTFLFCHTFRLIIQVYEVTHPSGSTQERHAFCVSQGR